MSGAVQPGHGTVRPNALSKVATTAPFQPLSLTTSHQHRLSLSGASAGTNQEHKSPASIGSHEDEHPQRLLDKWLSANSSLALGNINTTDLDFGMVPMPMLSRQNEYANGNMSMNADSTLGPSMDPEGWEGILSPNGTTRVASSRDPITADQVMAFQEPQRDTFHGISDRMAGSYKFEPNMAGEQITGFEAGMGDDLLGLTSNFEGNFQQDDSYWNSLIDGKRQRSSVRYISWLTRVVFYRNIDFERHNMSDYGPISEDTERDSILLPSTSRQFDRRVVTTMFVSTGLLPQV